MDDRFVDKLLALGIISALDLEDVGTEPLIAELGIDQDRAGQIIQAAAQAAKQAAAEGKATQAESLIKEQQKKRSRK